MPDTTFKLHNFFTKQDNQITPKCSEILKAVAVLRKSLFFPSHKQIERYLGKALCIMCVQYGGECSVPFGVFSMVGGFHDYRGGYLEYRGECSVP